LIGRAAAWITPPRRAIKCDYVQLRTAGATVAATAGAGACRHGQKRIEFFQERLSCPESMGPRSSPTLFKPDPLPPGQPA
jgi:hypothetical protein